MPRHSETRHLPWSPEQLFDLVADVGRYQEFLPWVAATRIRSNSETEMLADLIVGFKALKETFTSRVRKDRPNEISIDYVEGPLKYLHNEWRFRPDGAGGTIVDFSQFGTPNDFIGTRGHNINETNQVGGNLKWTIVEGLSFDADASYSRPLLRVEQAAVLKGKLTRPQFSAEDYNLYVRPSSVTGRPLINWSPAEGSGDSDAFATLADFQKKQPSFEAHSRFLAVAPSEVILSRALKNVRPSHALPVAAPEPAELVKLLGWPARPTYAPGAFQPE